MGELLSLEEEKAVVIEAVFFYLDKNLGPIRPEGQTFAQCMQFHFISPLFLSFKGFQRITLFQAHSFKYSYILVMI